MPALRSHCCFDGSLATKAHMTCITIIFKSGRQLQDLYFGSFYHATNPWSHSPGALNTPMFRGPCTLLSSQLMHNKPCGDVEGVWKF